VRIAYKAYTVVTEATKHEAGGWAARVSVYGGDGKLRVGTLELGSDVRFATAELADQAALLLGRAWIDRLPAHD
jgi:hypothetical protein